MGNFNTILTKSCTKLKPLDYTNAFGWLYKFTHNWMPFLVFPVFTLLVEAQGAKTIKKQKLICYDDEKAKIFEVSEFSIL